ncbi:Nuclear Hormone Receptor family [Caenorhabditis elegans]|uniref:Nuclear Hormone Receptor family n=2 Tax=Caenorhabditis elegans TaxID=6239 RepID=O16968_CAEEL|nr:Nuclear Hormone Receptor family [Caenorhabditis elegans]CCD73117.1 Nuclear Hormone Receptor family [Caenorhabditis elegans]|eukprot:NP_503221.2 Nuclear Hormone Receptor family [Caenorhabditis elegans]
MEETTSCPPCIICGQNGQGHHFGVISCRACAAFFRRAADSKWSRMKCLSKYCDGKTYHCKPCRLKKCRDVGMDVSKFQHDRDALQIVHPNRKRKLAQLADPIFSEPNFVFFFPQDREDLKLKKKNTYVDLSLLVSQAMEIIKTGPETPLVAKNQLQKLNFGFNCMKHTGIANFQRIHLVTRKEVTGFWEYHMLASAKWLTYFDEFQQLDQDVKRKILFGVWHVWGRLDKLMGTALFRIKNKEASLSDRVVGNGIVTDMNCVVAETKWMSRLPVQQLRYFIDGIRAWDLFPLIDELQALDITETELSFMLAQLCFQYAATRFGGKIAEVMEKFMDILSNNLHDYYIQEKMMPRYSGRLTKLLKINTAILENIRNYRTRADIAKVFDVFNLEFSHPEMFFDTGFI